MDTNSEEGAHLQRHTSKLILCLYLTPSRGVSRPSAAASGGDKHDMARGPHGHGPAPAPSLLGGSSGLAHPMVDQALYAPQRAGLMRTSGRKADPDQSKHVFLCQQSVCHQVASVSCWRPAVQQQQQPNHLDTSDPVPLNSTSAPTNTPCTVCHAKTGLTELYASSLQWVFSAGH